MRRVVPNAVRSCGTVVVRTRTANITGTPSGTMKAMMNQGITRKRSHYEKRHDDSMGQRVRGLREVHGAEPYGLCRLA